MAKENEKSLATPIMALVFIAIAGVVYWDTTSYTDPDSYVFPRAIAFAMAALSVLAIIRWFVRPFPEVISFEGSNVRRAALVVTMLGAAASMPLLGFFVSALLAFGIILLIAMYDKWTTRRAILFPLSGVVIVSLLTYLFKEVLKVPLPTGILFGG